MRNKKSCPSRRGRGLSINYRTVGFLGEEWTARERTALVRRLRARGVCALAVHAKRSYSRKVFVLLAENGKVTKAKKVIGKRITKGILPIIEKYSR